MTHSKPHYVSGLYLKYYSSDFFKYIIMNQQVKGAMMSLTTSTVLIMVSTTTYHAKSYCLQLLDATQTFELFPLYAEHMQHSLRCSQAME